MNDKQFPTPDSGSQFGQSEAEKYLQYFPDLYEAHQAFLALFEESQLFPQSSYSPLQTKIANEALSVLNTTAEVINAGGKSEYAMYGNKEDASQYGLCRISKIALDKTIGYHLLSINPYQDTFPIFVDDPDVSSQILLFQNDTDINPSLFFKKVIENLYPDLIAMWYRDSVIGRAMEFAGTRNGVYSANWEMHFIHYGTMSLTDTIYHVFSRVSDVGGKRPVFSGHSIKPPFGLPPLEMLATPV